MNRAVLTALAGIVNLIPRSAAAFLLALVIVSPTAAQSTENHIAPDARALLFQVRSHFSPESFSGATLSMKWHSDSSRARRLGLTVGGELIASDERDRQVLQVEAEYLYVRYRRSRTPIYLYHGLGPAAGVHFARRDHGGDWDRNVEAHAGAAGALGVEWMVSDFIGLMAEYHGAILLTFGRREPVGRDDFYEYGVRVHSRGARAGISVYF